MLRASIIRSQPGSTGVLRPDFIPIPIALLALGGLMLLCGTSLGQLRRVPDEGIPTFFGGGTRQVRTVWENPTPKPVEASLAIRVFQASSATAMSGSGPLPWKKLTVLASQTILEVAPVEFPAVKAATRFVVQWLDEGKAAVARLECLVYPTDLLKELALLAGGKPLGVLDPQNHLKPLLKNMHIEIEDLGDRGLEYFDGRLAILEPLASGEEARTEFSRTIEQKAQAGVGIVWIQPARQIRREPSTRFFRRGPGAVAVTDAGAIGNLADSPQAQLSVLQLARFVVKPELLTLPYSKE